MILLADVIGTFEHSGVKGILRQFLAAFPALPAFKAKNHWVKPGASRRVYFDRKGVVYYEVIVSNDKGEYRQLVLDPVPSKDNSYRFKDNLYIIENWSILRPVTNDVLSATLEYDKSWLLWMLIVVGIGECALFGWLLGL